MRHRAGIDKPHDSDTDSRSDPYDTEGNPPRRGRARRPRPGLQDLIGELSTRSEEFRVRWAAHNVQVHWSGVKNFRHPVVGDLTVAYESLECPGDAGQSIFVYMAEPNWSSQESLDLLASWATTPASISAENLDD